MYKPPGQVGPSTFRARAEAEANLTQTFLVARFQIDTCVPWREGPCGLCSSPPPPRGGSSCGRYAVLLVSTHPSPWGTAPAEIAFVLMWIRARDVCKRSAHPGLDMTCGRPAVKPLVGTITPPTRRGLTTYALRALYDVPYCHPALKSPP
jgi:hypothetical protein